MVKQHAIEIDVPMGLALMLEDLFRLPPFKDAVMGNESRPALHGLASSSRVFRQLVSGLSIVFNSSHPVAQGESSFYANAQSSRGTAGPVEADCSLKKALEMALQSLHMLCYTVHMTNKEQTGTYCCKSGNALCSDGS